MVRAFAAALLGLVLREGATAIGSVVQARPVLLATVHGQEGHAATRTHAVPEAATKLEARDDTLPPSRRLGVLLLVAGREEGLGPSLGQAQADGDVVHAPVALGALGLAPRAVCQLGHEALRGPSLGEAHVAPGVNAVPPAPVEHIGAEGVVTLPLPKLPKALLLTLAVGTGVAAVTRLEVAKAREVVLPFAVARAVARAGLLGRADGASARVGDAVAPSRPEVVAHEASAIHGHGRAQVVLTVPRAALQVVQTVLADAEAT